MSGEVAVEIPEHERRSWEAYLEHGSVKKAAARLGLHEITVARHLSAIRSRLGVETNAQVAAILAQRLEN